MNRLKRVVIKEELVALTGDFIKAVILNQFIYWSERVADFDRFIEEEKKRMSQIGEECNIQTTSGWIYKSAEELSDETMLGLSAQSVRRYIKELVAMGYLEERTNPKYSWDRTKQYRVDLYKIICELNKLGYALEGYPISKMEVASDNFGECNFQNGGSNLQNGASNLQDGGAIPEITTEITTENIIRQSSLVHREKENEKVKEKTDQTDPIQELGDIFRNCNYEDFEPSQQTIIAEAVVGLLTGDMDYIKPRSVVKAKLKKLDYWAVVKALDGYFSQKDMIRKPLPYFQTCLLSALVENELEMGRLVRNTS